MGFATSCVLGRFSAYNTRIRIRLVKAIIRVDAIKVGSIEYALELELRK